MTVIVLISSSAGWIGHPSDGDPPPSTGPPTPVETLSVPSTAPPPEPPPAAPGARSAATSASGHHRGDDDRHERLDHDEHGDDE